MHVVVLWFSVVGHVSLKVVTRVVPFVYLAVNCLPSDVKRSALLSYMVL